MIKDLEGSYRDLIEVLSGHLPRGNEEDTKILRRVGVPAEI
jgi:hypothetical protein